MWIQQNTLLFALVPVVAAAQPDIRATDGGYMSYNANLNGGQLEWSWIEYQVLNYSVPSINMGFYLSTNSSITTSDVLIASEVIGGVWASQGLYVYFPEQVLGTTYYHLYNINTMPNVPHNVWLKGGVIFDYTNSIVETNEGNNSALSTGGFQIIIADVPEYLQGSGVFVHAGASGSNTVVLSSEIAIADAVLELFDLSGRSLMRISVGNISTGGNRDVRLPSTV
ncbi:MAG: hypothetical protein ABI599_09960, partial [Flavobacteriales bacterium]